MTDPMIGRALKHYRVESLIGRARRPKPRPAGEQQGQNQYPAAQSGHSAETLNQTARQRKEGNLLTY